MAQAVVNERRWEELAASRMRLLEAGDETRRRLESGLHEGAHQHVVALALKLRVALGRADPASEEAEVLRDALADAMEASAELSELARGLHPAVLSERGLAAALQAVAARSALPVNLRALPGKRHSAVIETTAYLMVTEALGNVAAHAQANEAWLHADDRGGTLIVEVRDDGIGGAVATPGGGLDVHRGPRRRAGRDVHAREPARRHHRADRDPHRVSGWRYSFHDQIRYGDLDTNAHLNNVAVHGFFESARVAYMRELFPDIAAARPLGSVRDDLRRDPRAVRLARLLRGGPAGGRAADRAAALEREDRVRDALRGRRAARRRRLGHARGLRLRGRSRRAAPGGGRGAAAVLRCRTPLMEIERKWVLDAAPDGLAEHRSQRFEQGYLAIDPAGAEVRVRRKDGTKSVMTVKTGMGLVRGEEEWEIDPNFDALWALTGERRCSRRATSSRSAT